MPARMRRQIHVIRPKADPSAATARRATVLSGRVAGSLQLHRWTRAGTRGAALLADRVFSAAEAKGGSAIDATKTALLLVEYQ